MKKFLMFILVGCLVVLLGFPRPAAADHIDQVLAGINRNHQAIGNVIPGLHNLEVGRDKPSLCGNHGLTDKTIFNYYGSPGGYGCLRLYGFLDFYEYGERVPDLPNSENHVVNIPSTSGHQLGRYFTRQHPELAIIGVNLLTKPFHTHIGDFWLSPDYGPGGIKIRQPFQVDNNAVSWASLPSNNPYAPTVHQLLIAEDTLPSELLISPQSRVIRNRGRSVLLFVNSNVGRNSVTLYFKNFYLVMFASTATVNQDTIENIVRSIVTGSSPSGSIPTVNSSFSAPTLTQGQTTNLPIDVSTVFNPSANSWTYTVSDLDLPPGLTFDSTTKSIIVDPSSPPPPGPQSSGSFAVPITVDDHDGHVVNSSFNLTVNP